MNLDGHIHIRTLAKNPAGFLKELAQADMSGGIVISLPPPAFPAVAPSLPPAERMDNVLAWCRAGENLYPFYWIDPLEADALDQVSMAAARGALGFKVICDRYSPGDGRAQAVFAAIALTGRPILFHSGILWDGKPSSPHNRPAEFEALLEIKGLRFALAHIGWPWCDELIAVYGKFLNAEGKGAASGVEMFIDTTPGTPPIYRQDALTKLFTIGYDVQQNVLFGTDCCTDGYNMAWAREWMDRDRGIYKALGLTGETINAVFGGNLRRFVGLVSSSGRRKAPKPGQ
jgi:predicted TIM-barrel fold metal-dependent hydrolase